MGGGCFGHSRFFSQNHIPFTSCFAMMYILGEAVRLVKPERPAEVKISSRPTEKELERVSSYVAKEKRYSSGRQIVKLWAKTVPQTLGSRAKHYSEKNLISMVENLISGLKGQAVGNLNLSDVIIIHRSPICSVAPKHEDIGFGFID